MDDRHGSFVDEVNKVLAEKYGAGPLKSRQALALAEVAEARLDRLREELKSELGLLWARFGEDPP